MAVKLPPCDKCGESGCEWRSSRWKASWMLHDPEGYAEYVWWKARRVAEAERTDRRTSRASRKRFFRSWL